MQISEKDEAMAENKRLKKEIEEISDERDIKTVKGYECGIKVLNGSASLMLWKLWSDVFTDETKEYSDFYFSRKASESFCYSLNDKDEREPVSMLIRTPYSLRMSTDTETSKMNADFIVGVATRLEYRHRGCMDAVLKTALNDMYDEKVPFAFLIPADPAIYAPYGFTYFDFQSRWDKIKSFIDKDSSCFEEELESPIEEWMDFEKKNVKRQFSVYMKRNRKYYINLFDECRADGGGITLIRRVKDQMPAGCYSFISENGVKTITGMILDHEMLRRFKKDVKGGIDEGLIPFMMGRTADAESMLKMLRTKKRYDHRVVIRFRITDDIVQGNNAYYVCRVSDKKCSVTKICEDNIGKKDAERFPVIDVSELTGMFGMMGCGNDASLVKNADKLFLFNRCFLNELT